MTTAVLTKLCETISTTSLQDKSQELTDWINQQAAAYNLTYLLAHAEDGVIWGHFPQGKLVTSGEAFPQLAQLRSLTLQQCRIFGAAGEVMLWKSDEGWRSRFCNGDIAVRYEVKKRYEEDQILYIPEDQMLWGTQQEAQSGGFTLVADGSQGLQHALPLQNIPFSTDKTKSVRPLRLKVHHYFSEDEDGLAYICLSQLVGLSTVPSVKN